MELKPCSKTVFQHQDTHLTVGDNAPHRLYRFVLVRRSSWNFQPWIYVADCRRRTRLKIWPQISQFQLPITSLLIPTKQLNYLQDTQLTVADNVLHRLYRFVLVRRSSWNFESSNYVADCRRRTKLKTVLQNNIIDHISNTSTLPPDKSSHQRLHIFSSIVGSARDFELDNYAADCRRRSKLKTTPKKNINTTDRILCTTPLLPPDRLSYLLWCKSYLGEILMTLGLSLIELNHGTDDCQERVKSEATPIKCGYHHDMVVALLTRSFTESDHDIIMADEDGDWNSESWTVSTATARTQNQDLEQNLAENLHLDVSELMKTRLAARAKLLLQKGMHPDAEVPTGRQTHAAYSRSTGVSYDASTVNSEQTNTFTENPQKKYATAKLKLAENTAELATKDREKEDQKNSLPSFYVKWESTMRTTSSPTLIVQNQTPLVTTTMNHLTTTALLLHPTRTTIQKDIQMQVTVKWICLMLKKTALAKILRHIQQLMTNQLRNLNKYFALKWTLLKP